MDSLFGKAYLLQSEKKSDDALQTYNVVLGLFPDYMPALIEKAQVHLAMGDWEDAKETCHRCHERDQNCIAAHRIIALHSLCRVGNNGESARAIGALLQAIDATGTLLHVCDGCPATPPDSTACACVEGGVLRHLLEMAHSYCWSQIVTILFSSLPPPSLFLSLYPIALNYFQYMLC